MWCLSGLCYCVHLSVRSLLLCSHDVCRVSVVVFTWCLSGLCCCVHVMSVRYLLLCSHDVCQVSAVVFTWCLSGLCCVHMSFRSVVFTWCLSGLLLCSRDVCQFSFVVFTWHLSGLLLCSHYVCQALVVVFTWCLSGLCCVHVMSFRSLLCSRDVFQVLINSLCSLSVMLTFFILSNIFYFRNSNLWLVIFIFLSCVT